jgi:DNA-directed RNA polymerase II subunit RPB1
MALEIYNENTRYIKEIEFSIFGNQEVKKYSVIGKKGDPNTITFAETYENNNEPKKYGIVDLRLGTTDNGRECATCGLNSTICPGHFGYVDFVEPVIHYGWKDNIKTILGCICLCCSKLLINKPDNEIKKLLHNKYGKACFDEIKHITSNVNMCPSCNSPVPKIKMEIKNGIIQIMAEYNNNDENDENTQVISKKIKDYILPGRIYAIFRNISDEDCKLLGLNPEKSRPEDMIIEKFPIPPVHIRPSVKMDMLVNGFAEDTLNNKIADIIKANNALMRYKDINNITNEELKFRNDFAHCLQYNVTAFYDNDNNLPRTEVRSCGRSIKSISERIKGKSGRIRNNLMGKRVNFCARSVITSDPNLNIDELGVPIKIAMSVTFPEIVTPNNIDFLSKLVQNGRNIYPGANYIFYKRKDNNKQFIIDLRYRKKPIKLNYGDIVERHILNGDYVLFNRQPTLHKMSMMCHRVKIINNDKLSTFRINVTCTTPYNADFDGDEMNMFIPQSIQTQVELAEIADVKKQIISPRNADTIIKLKQDTVIGSYKMTEIKRIINWHDAMNLAMYTYNTDVYKIKKKDIDSLEMYSLIIPDMINYKDKKIDIINGNIKNGILDASILNNKIINFTWDRYGDEITKDFIDNTQRLVTNWLIIYGFTIGLKDAIPSKELNEKILTFMEKLKLDVDYEITKIENNPDMLMSDIFEDMITKKLSKRGDIGVQTIEALNSENNFFTIINSGAKGSKENLGQILCGNAQDILKLKRLPKQVNGRTMPHFFQNDDRADARGFITNSFYSGFTPSEFWFHSMTGREGLISTAIKTGDTGYMQRKLIKGMEDLIVCYDHTVRTSNNIMIQTLYGGSQINQSMQKTVKLYILTMDNKTVFEKLCFTDEEIKKYNINSEDNNKIYKLLIELRDHMRVAQMKVMNDYITLREIYFQPVNYERIIQDAKNYISKQNEKLTFDYIIEKIEFLLEHDNTPLVCIGDKLKFPNKLNDEKLAKVLFKLALYEYFSPKRCLIEYKLNKEQFETIITEIIRSFKNAIVHPGEMVGIITAQSMGEPLTQMTLNMFHKTGGGAAGLQGVPRMKELLSYSKNIQTPYMYIYLKPEFNQDKVIAQKIVSHLKYTIIKDLIQKIDIIYDSNVTSKDSYTVIDNIDVQTSFDIKQPVKNLENVPWLFRITLQKEAMLENDVNMLDIKTSFINFWKDNYNDVSGLKKNIKDIISKVSNACILTNNSNSLEPIVHIRFDLNSVDNKILLELYEIILNKFNLKGSENITRNSDINQDNMVCFDSETGKYEIKKEYVIYCNGIDLLMIKNIPAIDMTRTIVNDLYTIYKHYGIEAARMLLIREMNNVFNSTPVSYHHLSLLADMMTATGGITSIDRHGINKLDTDPLSRASLEVPIDQFLKAALFNEIDKMNSVSSQIMVGRAFKGGTGLCEIVLDNEFLQNSEYHDIRDNKHYNKYIELETNSLMNDIFNRTDIDDVYLPNT